MIKLKFKDIQYVRWYLNSSFKTAKIMRKKHFKIQMLLAGNILKIRVVGASSQISTTLPTTSLCTFNNKLHTFLRKQLLL